MVLENINNSLSILAAFSLFFPLSRESALSRWYVIRI